MVPSPSSATSTAPRSASCRLARLAGVLRRHPRRLAGSDRAGHLLLGGIDRFEHPTALRCHGIVPTTRALERERLVQSAAELLRRARRAGSGHRQTDRAPARGREGIEPAAASSRATPRRRRWPVGWHTAERSWLGGTMSMPMRCVPWPRPCCVMTASTPWCSPARPMAPGGDRGGHRRGRPTRCSWSVRWGPSSAAEAEVRPSWHWPVARTRPGSRRRWTRPSDSSPREWEGRGCRTRTRAGSPRWTSGSGG